MKEIREIEKEIKKTMSGDPAHSLAHVERVRRFAVAIAKKEKFKNIVQVEAAALLHDIGRFNKTPGVKHGLCGAVYARNFLADKGFFTPEEREEICLAIEHHDSNRGGSGKLLDILRDADMLDGLGAMGILRGVSSTADRPIFDINDPRGRSWGQGVKYFDKRLDAKKGTGETVIDEINFQISWEGNIATKTGKRMAKKKIDFMKLFLKEFFGEV